MPAVVTAAAGGKTEGVNFVMVKVVLSVLVAVARLVLGRYKPVQQRGPKCFDSRYALRGSEWLEAIENCVSAANGCDENSRLVNLHRLFHSMPNRSKQRWTRYAVTASEAWCCLVGGRRKGGQPETFCVGACW